MTMINPELLFGWHGECKDEFRPCLVCDPTSELAYIMRVGEQYYPTPGDFIKEGISQGYSKRIAQIPRNFKVGKTVIYLAHINACIVKEPVSALQQAESLLKQEESPRLVEVEKVKRVMGIFSAFIPQRIEKIYWQSELDAMSDKELESLEKRGITPVGVKDGDKDHA
jgi:hypothetical protein